MAKKLLAVYDADLSYVNRFVGYLKGKKNLPFKAIGFSKAETLENFAERNLIDILLISDNCAHSEANQSEQFLNKQKAADVIYLGDPKVKTRELRKINKYQSMENIISELVAECRLEDAENSEMSNLINAEVYGIYSPACDFRKQSFGLAMGDVLSQSRSVLYINLERFSGLKEILNEKNKSISDVIYFFKTRSGQLGEELRRSRIRKRNFDILLGPEDMEDMDLVSEGNLSNFLAFIAKAGAYDAIVIDMDEAYKKITDMFEICTKIFVPVVRGKLAQIKIDEFMEFLNIREKESVKEKIVFSYLETMSSQELDIVQNEARDYLDNCFFGKIRVKAEEAIRKC